MHTTTPSDLDPRRSRGPAFVLRPALLGLMVYAVLLWIGHVWVLTTMTGAELEALSTDGLLGPITLPMVLGFVHLGWLLLMARELRLSRSAPLGLERAHAAGAIVGIVISAALIGLAIWAALLY